MAKVKQKKYHVEAVGEDIAFTADVSVNSGGVFRIQIPAFLSELAQHYVKEREDVWVQQPRKHWAVFGKNLRELEQFVWSILEAYAAPAEEKRLVIAYRFCAEYSAAFAPDGRPWPNCSYCPPGEPGGPDYNGKWCGPLHATRRAPVYSLGLAAAVMEETRLTRGGHTTCSYARFCCNDAEDRGLGYGGQLLSSFVGFEWYQDRQQLDKDVRLMPYTEEAATFFANALLALCKLCHEVEERFASDETVQQMITAQPNLLGYTQEGSS